MTMTMTFAERKFANAIFTNTLSVDGAEKKRLQLLLENWRSQLSWEIVPCI